MWDSDEDDNEVCRLLGCDAVRLATYVSKFTRNLLIPSYGDDGNIWLLRNIGIYLQEHTLSFHKTVQFNNSSD